MEHYSIGLVWFSLCKSMLTVTSHFLVCIMFVFQVYLIYQFPRNQDKADWLPHLTYFCFVTEFSQGLVVHLHKPLCYLYCISCSWGWIILEHWGDDPWKVASFARPILSPGASSHGTLPSSLLNRLKSDLLKARVTILLFALLLPLRILNSTIHNPCSQGCPWPSHSSPILPCSYVSGPTGCLVISSVTCVRKLLSMNSRNLLDCLCPSSLPKDIRVVHVPHDD